MRIYKTNYMQNTSQITSVVHSIIQGIFVDSYCAAVLILNFPLYHLKKIVVWRLWTDHDILYSYYTSIFINFLYYCMKAANIY